MLDLLIAVRSGHQLAEPATIVAPAAFGQRRIDVADRPCGRRHIESVAIVVRWNVCFQ